MLSNIYHRKIPNTTLRRKVLKGKELPGHPNDDRHNKSKFYHFPEGDSGFSAIFVARDLRVVQVHLKLPQLKPLKVKVVIETCH